MGFSGNNGDAGYKCRQGFNVTHCNTLESPLSATIDYYFSPPSPWTYLGHARFTDMARRAGASIRVLPTDFGKVFAVSGGLSLAQRAPQRQAGYLVPLGESAAGAVGLDMERACVVLAFLLLLLC